MQKYFLRIYQAVLVVFVATTLVLSCIFIIKSDQIVTENITLKYFETSLNTYSKEKLRDFVADSENDILYKNLVTFTYPKSLQTSVAALLCWQLSLQYRSERMRLLLR